VVTGDGFVGLDREGPYNGIHVTAGVRQVPYAWLEQCLPGARIVMPWGTDFNPYDRLLTLTVGKDSRSASGRFAGALSYMKLRTQRLVIDHNAYTPDGWWDAGRERETALELKDAEEMTSTDTSFVLGLKVPDCVQHPNVNEDGSVTVWLYSTRDKSVAVATFSKGEPPDVTESGDRSLWAEVEGAYTWWVERDSPQPEQFGLTVAQQEQRVWLDSPTGESWALS
jgi:hypothetical protein